jgi:hypothetical protein
VGSAGDCLRNNAANAAKVESDTGLSTAGAVGFRYACGRDAPVPLFSSFASQSTPSDLEAGQYYPVSITLTNMGNNTWTAAESYYLGSQSPEDNFTWGLNRVALPHDVLPGEQVTFNFFITAPAEPGSYDFQWRMVQEGVEWFGDLSPNIPIEVYSFNYCPILESDCREQGGRLDSVACQCDYGPLEY